jgi:branched-chain amino acid transport system ATP-binding protein
VHALRGVSLEVRRGEVVGLIGPNGAGKSTLVNVVTGFDRPTSGTVELEGRDITRWTPNRRGRHGLARTFQHSHAFRDLSVRENVEVAALGAGARRREAQRRAANLLELLSLAEHAGRSASTLAHGDERRLGVARALATEPRFVLLDEPAAGLPDEETEHLGRVIRRIPEHTGALVILVDHDMSLVSACCQVTAVLDFGRLIATGPTVEVLRDEQVVRAYLGTEDVEEAPAA